MKVIVNNEESYDFKLPEEINLNQIDVVIDRLTKLRKLFGSEMPFRKNHIGRPPKNNGNAVEPHNPNQRYTREQIIEALKIYYNPSLSAYDITMRLEKMGFKRRTFQTGIWHLKQRFGISNADVELMKQGKYNGK